MPANIKDVQNHNGNKKTTRIFMPLCSTIELGFLKRHGYDQESTLTDLIKI